MILKFTQYLKITKAQFLINSDLEFLIKILRKCKNNSKILSEIKVGEYIPCGFSGWLILIA